MWCVFSKAFSNKMKDSTVNYMAVARAVNLFPEAICTGIIVMILYGMLAACRG